MTQAGTKASEAYADVVALDRYPIHQLDSDAGRALIAQCHAELAAKGACTLPGFITESAIEAMIALAAELSDKAWPTDEMHTVYNDAVDESVPPDHPRAVQLRSAKRGIAYDYIPSDAPLRRLYESDDMTRFMAAVLDKPVLYRSADPLDAFQITTMLEGEELTWHFDRSEFSVTVMYQQSEGGGHFDYCLGLRSEGDENYEGVRRVLEGDESAAIRLPSAPGTLAVFRGRYAMHRVTPVEGSTPRINSVLSYGERSDMKLNDVTSKRIYGRTS